MIPDSSNTVEMAEMMTTFEQDCATAVEAVKRRVSEVESTARTTGNPDRERILREANRTLLTATENVSRMQAGLRQLSPSERHRGNAKVRNFKNQIQQLESKLKQLGTSDQRNQLFAGMGPTANTAETGNNIEAFNASAGRANGSLNEARRVLDESDEIGLNVLDNMHTQRETLLRAHEKVRETNSMAEEARLVLKRMAYRALYNKAFLVMVILVELLCIGLVLYYGYIKK